MMHTKTKPNSGLNAAAFSDIFSCECADYQPLQCCQITCANKDEVKKTKQLVQCSFLASFKPINALVDAAFSSLLRFLFLVKVTPINVFSGAAFC